MDAMGFGKLKIRWTWDEPNKKHKMYGIYDMYELDVSTLFCL